jgi:hypothetical protein
VNEKALIDRIMAVILRLETGVVKERVRLARCVRGDYTER